MKKSLILASLFTVCCFTQAIGAEKPFNLNAPLSFEKGISQKPAPMYSDKLIAIGGNVSLLKLFGNNTMFGVNLNGLYSPDGERNAYFGSLGYFLGGKNVDETTAYASSSATNPRSQDVTLTSKFSGVGVLVGYRRYLLKDISEDGFKMYFNVMAGLFLFKGTTEASVYDSDNYNLSFEKDVTASGPVIGGGYGLESRMNDKMSVFGDLNITIPATSANGQAIEVELPPALLINFGLRIDL